jgi:hypothetical protein
MQKSESGSAETEQSSEKKETVKQEQQNLTSASDNKVSESADGLLAGKKTTEGVDDFPEYSEDGDITTPGLRINPNKTFMLMKHNGKPATCFWRPDNTIRKVGPPSNFHNKDKATITEQSFPRICCSDCAAFKLAIDKKEKEFLVSLHCSGGDERPITHTVPFDKVIKVTEEDIKKAEKAGNSDILVESPKLQVIKGMELENPDRAFE